jgi:GABA(A) receptor-associated protein
MTAYQKKHDFETRLSESKRIRSRYPDRIPIIMEKHTSLNNLATMNQTKFLVPETITVAELLFILRKRIKLEPHQALFLFINETMPNSSDIINTLYINHVKEDGFLYITYSTENTFGAHV